MKRLYTRILFIFTVLAAFLVADCWKAEPHKTPWEVEEQAYLSYEEYFSQQRLYDYAEDVFSGWSLQDSDVYFKKGCIQYPSLFIKVAVSMYDNEETGEVSTAFLSRHISGNIDEGSLKYVKPRL